MANKGRRYPAEYRKRVVALVRGGQSPEELALEYEASPRAIRRWVMDADAAEGRRADGWTREEREELQELQRENRRLKKENAFLKKAAAWFARETSSGGID